MQRTIPDWLVMHFRDDTSAFDGTKVSQLAQKGETQQPDHAFIMGSSPPRCIDPFRGCS